MRTTSCLIVSTLFLIGAHAAPTQLISTQHTSKGLAQARQFHTADFSSSAPNIATPVREFDDKFPGSHGIVMDKTTYVSDKARAVAKKSTKEGSIDLEARKEDDFRTMYPGRKPHNHKTDTQVDEKRPVPPTPQTT